MRQTRSRKKSTDTSGTERQKVVPMTDLKRLRDKWRGEDFDSPYAEDLNYLIRRWESYGTN